MKMPIAWHEQCLTNAKNSIARDRQVANGMLLRLAGQEAALQHSENQIRTAKEKGMDGFDAERFGKKRSLTTREQP